MVVINTDFKQINFVKTDIYGLTKLCQGLFTAPAERPVLSRRREQVCKPQRGTLVKMETRIWTLSYTDNTDAHRFLW